IAAVEREADDVIGVVLEDPRGLALPAWTPGAHIDLIAGPFTRRYSLCGSPSDTSRYRVAILKEQDGRGGSAHFHETLRAGQIVHIRGPPNPFRLDEQADHTVLVAGGIGITPIIAMAARLKALGRSYELHYCGRSPAGMAFLDRLRAEHPGLRLYAG